MNKKCILIILALLLCFTGCAKTNSTLKETAPAVGDIFALDWDEISTKSDEIFLDETKYPMNQSVNYNLDEENQVFNLVLFVDEDTTAETAVQYITEAAKGINDMAAEQDSYFKVSGENSYGGLYETLALHLMVIPGGPDALEEDYLVNQLIPAGTYEEVVGK